MSKYVTIPWSPPVRVLKEGLDVGADCWGEKVALDCGDTFRGSCRYYVNADDTAIGASTVDGNL